MSRLRRLLIACSASLMCCGAGAAGVDALQACAEQAPDEAMGLSELAEACPELESALRETGLVEQLPAGWRDTLDATALDDVAHFARRYGDAPAQAAPDTAGLRDILQQLASERATPKRSWWQAFKEWFRSWFQRQGSSSTPWFERLLERLAESANLAKVIAYGLLALVVIAAIAFVVNELRIAGVLTRRRATNAGQAAVDAVLPAGEAGRAVGDLDSAPLHDQPSILLRLLVARLLANGQLRGERSLTHRELVRHASFADGDSRTCFSRVSQLAERVLYGAGVANEEQASAVLADGRRLLQQLQLPAGGRA